MLMPAPVVVGGPSPGVGGVPVPACIGPQPGSTVAIRLPGRVGDHHRRAPAPAVAGDFHPTAVRGQRLVEHLLAHDRRGLGGGDRHRGPGRRRRRRPFGGAGRGSGRSRPLGRGNHEGARGRAGGTDDRSRGGGCGLSGRRGRETLRTDCGGLAHQHVDDVRRHAQIVEVHDLTGSQGEGFADVGDVLGDDPLVDATPGELHHIGDRCGQGRRRRDRDRG